MAAERSTVHSKDRLRELYDPPVGLAVAIKRPRLDRWHRRFVEESGFLCIASVDADGLPSVSPRGDPKGFVRVLDDSTLLIPDRPGNNQLHTLSRVLDNPHVALVFFVSGVDETLRVTGTADIVTDPALLEPAAVRGRVPVSALRVHVTQAWVHCGKALKRGGLWDPSQRVERASFPSLAAILRAQGDADLDEAEAEDLVEDLYTTKMY